MLEAVPVLERHYRLALAELGASLKQLFGSEFISEPILQSTYPKRSFIAGWRIPTDCQGTVLELLIDRGYPFSQPRIGLGSAAKFLVWPHVEEDGVLCLPTANVTHDAIERARTALGAGHKLVSLNLVAPPRQDFQNEFLSYWARDPKKRGQQFTSILRAAAPSRRIAVWHGEVWTIVAEDELALQKWFDNRVGPQKTARNVEPAALIWLPEPLCPDQYPRTASDVWELTRNLKDARSLFCDLAGASPRRIVAVIGSDSENGPCLAAVTVPPPRSGTPERKRDILQNGFRKGHVPAKIASTRFWNADSPVTPSKVSRADAAWVHGRGRDPSQEKLAAAAVVILGAGSVGAPVAIQLAMAGVGRLVIIDPEQLTAANTGRHPLGAKFIDRHKAEALVAELRENYPHHQFEFRNRSWQDITNEEPQLLANSSLIISVTGDWDTDDALNTWHVDRGRVPPILYGWTEEHACAGHAVLINGEGEACFACGMDAHGRPRLRVTGWNGSELNQQPGCGSLYQPYGPVELAHTVSLISELALDALVCEHAAFVHRIWACTSRFLQSCGGWWNQEWLKISNQRVEGGFQTEREWPQEPGCRACGGSV